MFKMKTAISLLKVLLFLRFSVRLSTADTESLQYLYTAIRPKIHFPEITAVGQVDGEVFMYYDCCLGKVVPKTDWIQINAEDSDYWNKETRRMQDQQDSLQYIMTLLMQNHTEGGHVLQLMNGCQLHNDKTTTSYMKFGYNGEDFFHLDLKTETWTTDKHQAGIIIKKSDPEGHEAKHWKDYLEKDCIDELNNAVSHGRETLERKVRPQTSVFKKHSPYPEVVCHATGFFPKALNMTWQKNEEDVYEDVELKETLPNQDGSFQKRSVLKVSAEELQKHKYTCVIQHSSLKQELVVEVPQGEGNIGVIPVVVPLVAFIAVVVGIVICKKKRKTKKKRKNSDFKPIQMSFRQNN